MQASVNVLQVGIGIGFSDGSYSVIFKSGTRYPAKAKRRYFITETEKKIFTVYEGENTQANENRELYSASVPSFPSPGFVEDLYVDIILELDSNGLLKIVGKFSTAAAIECTIDFRCRQAIKPLEQLFKELAINADNDKQKKILIEARLELRSNVENIKKRYQNKKNIPYNKKQIIMGNCDEVLEWLDEHPDETLDEETINLAKQIERDAKELIDLLLMAFKTKSRSSTQQIIKNSVKFIIWPVISKYLFQLLIILCIRNIFDIFGSRTKNAKDKINKDQKSKFSKISKSAQLRKMVDFLEQFASTSFYPVIKKPPLCDRFLNMVGMDIGTTRCCVATHRIYDIEALSLDDDTARSMPSFVAYEEKEAPKCGKIAYSRIKHSPKSTTFDIKRIIGKSFESIVTDANWPFKVLEDNGKVKVKIQDRNGIDILKSPEEITSTLIERMKMEIEENRGQNPLLEAVITVPASFNQDQIDSTLVAAVLAGLETVRILPEPIAACLTYASKQHIENNSNILLFDLGGGILNVCIIKIENESLYILGCYDDENLGGKNFDAILFNYFTAILKEKYNLDLINDKATLLKKYKLKEACQEIKHTLQTEESAWLNVSDIDANLESEITITREEFETLSDELLLRIKHKILGALNTLFLIPNNINYVLQAGGGCRMLMVKELLRSIFPNSQHFCILDPDLAVAYGATLYSYYLKKTKQREL